jgi:4-hydroxy-3-polyprenylbenzoate decarboxylase
MATKKIVVAISGASGAVYAQALLNKLTFLTDQVAEVGIVMSENAKINWHIELGNRDYEAYSRFRLYAPNDFFAPFASGSAQYDTMIVCPCSMGTLGRIAHGISDDLTTRAADVILKERRKLILVLRDTPYNLIHINNMRHVTEAGGIICPATPSFYSKPQTVHDVVLTVVDRVLDLAGFQHRSFRWGEDANE